MRFHFAFIVQLSAWDEVGVIQLLRLSLINLNGVLMGEMWVSIETK